MAGESAFPRGSEWRRWDLHVHTPYSALSHGFGTDFEAYAKTLLTKAVEANVAAIGVTDYFTIDGYKALRGLIANQHHLVELVGQEVAERANEILLIPNIELRLRDVIIKNGSQARVNFHMLFSDELTPEEIEEQFLHRLEFPYEGLPGGPDQMMALTVNNLAEFGALLKQQHENYRDRSDLVIGMMNAVISHEQVTKLLVDQQRRFKDRSLIVVGADEDLASVNWDGQAHQVRKQLLQKAEMVFSGNPRSRAFYLGADSTPAAFVREFKSLKPCIHGSDAHDFEKLFEPDGRRYLWVRSDPTFNGLRQLLHEPDARVFIGERPIALDVRDGNATKYLEAVTFTREAAGHPSEKWFSGSVPLNSGLVAVIGKKGSGKSALADVLGLLGNCRAHGDFSFLTPKRFLAPKHGLGSLFRAAIRWRSGDTVDRLLADPPDTTLPESVQYMPQNHLERICSEIGDGSSTTDFDRELETVIFSHVDPADRLGKQSLRELLDYRTAEKDATLTQLTQKLSEVNRQIVELQERLTAEYRAELEGQRTAREHELKAHEAAKPPPESEPATDADKMAESNTAREDLNRAVSAIRDLDAELASAQERREGAARQIAAVERLLTRMANLTATVEQFFAESADDVRLIGVDIESVVKLITDASELDRLRSDAVARRAALIAATDPDNPASLVARREEASRRADALRERLDEPTRRYEQYQHRLARWNHRRSEIIGTADDPMTLLGLTARLEAVDAVPEHLAKHHDVRDGLVSEIYRVKTDLLADYEGLYSPVQQFISGHPVSQETDALSFSATIAVGGVVDGLLGMIHQGRRGHFQGEQEGRELLESIVARHSFSTIDEVTAFTTEILEVLLSPGSDVAALTALRRQLVQGATPEELYDFLFGLSYLQPRFGLLWRGKALDQLSPGERGSLLLVFYLLIDRRDMPLVIDQPEENLDNETIWELLVPAIKYAKGRRQVIIVTHNPNLAVVCDADQIIHSSIDKRQGNAITYTSGSIEDPTITRRIVDVLEGTKPAFDLRDARYDVLEERG